MKIDDASFLNYRSILPWMSQICEKPKLLTHMFVCKEKDFKRFYGEFALNKTKSEAIIVQHNEYFNVSKTWIYITCATF